MQRTSVAVSPFLPTFAAWQEEVVMERRMLGLVKVALVAPTVMTALKVLLLTA